MICDFLRVIECHFILTDEEKKSQNKKKKKKKKKNKKRKNQAKPGEEPVEKKGRMESSGDK